MATTLNDTQVQAYLKQTPTGVAPADALNKLRGLGYDFSYKAPDSVTTPDSTASGIVQDAGTMAKGLANSILSSPVSFGLGIEKGLDSVFSGYAKSVGAQGMQNYFTADKASRDEVSTPLGKFKSDRSVLGFAGSALETAAYAPLGLGDAVFSALGKAPVTGAVEAVSKGVADVGTKGLLPVMKSIAPSVAKDTLSFGVPAGAGVAAKDIGNEHTDGGQAAVDFGLTAASSAVGSFLFHGTGGLLGLAARSTLRSEAAQGLYKQADTALKHITDTIPASLQKDVESAGGSEKYLSGTMKWLWSSATEHFDRVKQSIVSYVGDSLKTPVDKEGMLQGLRTQIYKAKSSLFKEIEDRYAPITKANIPVADYSLVKSAFNDAIAFSHKLHGSTSEEFNSSLNAVQSLMNMANSKTPLTIDHLLTNAYALFSKGSGEERKAITGMAESLIATGKKTLEDMGPQGEKLLKHWDAARDFSTNARIEMDKQYMTLEKHVNQISDYVRKLSDSKDFKEATPEGIKEIMKNLGTHADAVRQLMVNNLVDRASAGSTADSKLLRTAADKLGENGFLAPSDSARLHELADYMDMDFKKWLSKYRPGEKTPGGVPSETLQNASDLKSKVATLDKLSDSEASQVATDIASLKSPEEVLHATEHLNEDQKSLLSSQVVKSLLSDVYTPIKGVEGKYDFSKLMDKLDKMGNFFEAVSTETKDPEIFNKFKDIQESVDALKEHQGGEDAVGNISSLITGLLAAFTHRPAGAAYHLSKGLGSYAGGAGSIDQLASIINETLGKNRGKIPKAFWLRAGTKAAAKPAAAAAAHVEANNITGDGTTE